MSESKVGNVWHVDDDDAWRKMVSDVLEGDGHHVTSTPNASTARRMIPDDIRGIDVSILDGDLGDGRGAELARLIRQSQLSIAIIGLSGGDTPWADASLDKSNFDIGQLRATVNGFLGKQE